MGPAPRFRRAAGFCLAVFASLSVGAAVPADTLEGRAASTTSARGTSTSLAADGVCTNGLTSRACWTNGYSIATDFDQKFPTTGNTVTYNLKLTNGTCNPDGNGDRLCMLINNQYPGPLIRATWGDTLVINVQNSLQNNGTSIHWHGVRQYHSPGEDGVGGLSECALAPGTSKTYTFQVTQFGTSWYHSHFSSQYGDGIVGPIIFDGPASANYDIDLGPYLINEWYYQTAFQIQQITLDNLQAQGPPPNANNILINGTNKNPNNDGGSYNTVTIQSDKKYRLRLINNAVDNFIRVSLDNHVMEVMTSDFVPVKPFYAETLLMGIGQRYDVIINANQTAGNYWFRADVASDCLSGNDYYGRAIWTYENTSVVVGTPTSSGYVEPSNCAEPSPLAPFWVQPVPSGSFQSSLQQMDVNITQAQVVPGGEAVFVWALNTSSMDIAWDKPTLQYVMEGNTTDLPTRYNVLPTVSEGAWNYWLVQQLPDSPPIPHPIHLHGHDFFVLGQGSGTFSVESDTLNFATPTRRDTATLPAGGWLAIAFNSNNPGAWLMHCHIAWHVSEGLAVQFLEAPSQITLPDQSSFQTQCDNWKAYQSTEYYIKDDSGL